MHSTELVAHQTPTRQERLKLWLWSNNVPQAEIARQLGVTKSTVGKWVRAERLPTWRWKMLRDVGIPEELLPRAEDVPSGPRPKPSTNRTQHHGTS